MVDRDKNTSTETLFGNFRQGDLTLGDYWDRVDESSYRVDLFFRDWDLSAPGTVRKLSELIADQATREARAASLEQIPAAYRETVKILVERTFMRRAFERARNNGGR